jgi:hypothetical protein
LRAGTDDVTQRRTDIAGREPVMVSVDTAIGLAPRVNVRRIRSDPRIVCALAHQGQ